MGPSSDVDKYPEESPNLPRMLGDTDVGLILDFAERLEADAQILEVGPWLGGLTTELCRFGNVTVVDSFVWSERNAENIPGLADPGASFLHAFEENMARSGNSPNIVVAELPDFEWNGGTLNLVVIDAPRTPDNLHSCLNAIAASLSSDAVVMIKHGLNRTDLSMGAYLDGLIGLGVLEMVATNQPEWCNIAVLRPGTELMQFPSDQDASSIIANAPIPSEMSDPWYGRLLSIGRLGYLASQGYWAKTWERLSELPASGDNLTIWDTHEPEFIDFTNDVPDPLWAVFSVLFWVQNDKGLSSEPPVAIDPDFPARLRAYWCNNQHHEWKASLFEPSILTSIEARREVDALSPNGPAFFGAKVVQIGGEPSIGALVSLMSGAKCFDAIPLEGQSVDAKLTTMVQHYPHIKLAETADAAQVAIKGAQLVLVGPGLASDSPLSVQLAARVKNSRSKPLVIELA